METLVKEVKLQKSANFLESEMLKSLKDLIFNPNNPKLFINFHSCIFNELSIAFFLYDEHKAIGYHFFVLWIKFFRIDLWTLFVFNHVFHKYIEEVWERRTFLLQATTIDGNELGSSCEQKYW